MPARRRPVTESYGGGHGKLKFRMGHMLPSGS
jgi:hypothetical protein